MRAMKDSGIEWIGEIPGNWNIIRNKNAFLCEKTLVGENSNTTQLLSLTTKGIKEKDIENPEGKLPETFDTYQYVYKDNIVMCLFDLDCSAVFSGISQYDGMISPAYKVLKCRENIIPQYADYWFKYISNGRKFNHYAKNIRYTLNYDEFAILPILFPNITEQQAIADYLDHKCALIDNAIEKQKAIIEKLKAYKQSIITEAVTKGLNPDAPMKDSGIEWIGEIPEGWEVKPLFTLFKERKCKNINNIEHNLLSLSYGNIIKKDVSNNMGLIPESFEGYNIVEKNNIVFRLTDLQNDHVSLRSGLVLERGIITSAYVTIEKTIELNANYYSYLFRSYDLCKVFYNMGGGVRQGLNYGELKKMLLLAPDLHEQNFIANYLDNKCYKIEVAIKNKQNWIEKLEEYKKSLIYECVTGKKEINIS